jgi:hypothetical protein
MSGEKEKKKINNSYNRVREGGLEKRRRNKRKNMFVNVKPRCVPSKE